MVNGSRWVFWRARACGLTVLGFLLVHMSVRSVLKALPSQRTLLGLLVLSMLLPLTVTVVTAATVHIFLVLLLLLARAVQKSRRDPAHSDATANVDGSKPSRRVSFANVAVSAATSVLAAAVGLTSFAGWATLATFGSAAFELLRHVAPDTAGWIDTALGRPPPPRTTARLSGERFTVMDAGPHATRTARGCLIRVK